MSQSFQSLKLKIPAPISAVFWAWYDANQNDVIMRRKILFIKLKVKVHHLKPIFEQLFGKH